MRPRLRWWLAVLPLLVAPAAGLLATPAFASNPQNYLPCVKAINGKQVGETVGMTIYLWECQVPANQEAGTWNIIEEGSLVAEHQRFSYSPTWVGTVNVGLADATGGATDTAEASIQLQTPTGADLVRRLRVQLLVVDASIGEVCTDTTWREAPSPTMVFTTSVQEHFSYCSGDPQHQYEAWARGSFFSESLNAWVETPWVLSGRIGLPLPL